MSVGRETRSTCPYCGVGCGVIIESQGAQITGVRGDPDHPANFGRLCTKGSTLHLTAAHPVTLQARLLHPQLRSKRGDTPQRIGWDTALDMAVERFHGIIDRHGPDAVGFYISGQLLTEDYYVFNKLAKGLIGTNNVDTNSRLCMSSAVSVRRGSATMIFSAGLARLASSMRRNRIGCANAVFEPAMNSTAACAMSS